MKPGTIIQLPDGREGTIVYSGLDGYGFRWGRQRLRSYEIEQILSGNGDMLRVDRDVFDPFLAPQAMLRDPYPGTELECVGEKYTVLNVPTND